MPNASYRLQEKEGRKDAGKKPPAGKSSRETESVASSAADTPPEQLKKISLNRSYRQLKKVLWRRSESETGDDATPSSMTDSKSVRFPCVSVN